MKVLLIKLHMDHQNNTVISSKSLSFYHCFVNLFIYVLQHNIAYQLEGHLFLTMRLSIRKNKDDLNDATALFR